MRLVRNGYRLVYEPEAIVSSWKSPAQLSDDRTLAVDYCGGAALGLAYRLNFGRMPLGISLRSTARFIEATTDRVISGIVRQPDRAFSARRRQVGAKGMLETGVLGKAPPVRRVALDESAPLSKAVSERLPRPSRC